MASTSNNTSNNTSKEDAAQDRRESLTDAMSPLIDALSNLILCAVSGDMRAVQENAQGLALYTNKVVESARDIALATRDSKIQTDISECINGVAGSVERLVAALSLFMQKKDDFEAQKGFATAVKTLGDEINALVVATDESALSKLIAQIALCKEICATLRNVTSQQTMISEAKNLSSSLVELVGIVQTSASNAVDPRKAQLLQSGVGDTKAAIIGFIRGADQYWSSARSENDVRTFSSTHSAAVESLDKLLATARIAPDFSKKFNDAYDLALQQLIDLANALQQFSRRLVDLIDDPNHTTDDFVREATRAAKAAKAFIAHAEAQLAKIKDPGTRRIVQDNLNGIRALSAQLVQAAKAARENPNDPALKAKLKEINERLNGKIRNVLTLTTPEGEDLERKLELTSRYLDAIVAEMAEKLAAGNLTKDQLLEYRQAVRELTGTTAKHAQAIAAKTEDAATKEAIIKSVKNMAISCNGFSNVIEKLADNIDDPQLRKQFGQEKEAFEENVHLVRVATGLELPRIKDAKVPPPPPVTSDNELVQAAQQQAAAAMALAAQARAFAASIQDPGKRTKVLEGADLLDRLANDIIKAAQQAAEHPNDPEHQAALDKAQKLLAAAIRSIVELTAGKGSTLENLLAQMELSSGQTEGDAALFALATQTLEDIDAFVKHMADRSLSPKELVMKAREIASRAQELSKLLLKLAAATNDPQLKQQLRSMANILKDKGVQVKLLAAVQVAGIAAGGEDTGQVSSSLRGLRTEIGETINIVRVAALRRRVHSTNKQTEAMRKLLQSWKQANQLIN